MADRFKSPLRDEGDITEHDRIESLVRETVDIFRDIDRAQGEVSPNVDGVGCVVVEHTNMDDDHDTRLVSEPPAPQDGDIVHYPEFLGIVAETFEERWLRGDTPDVSSFANTDLRAELNQQVIRVARSAHLVGEEIRDESVSAESVAEIRADIERLETVLREIERKHLE